MTLPADSSELQGNDTHTTLERLVSPMHSDVEWALSAHSANSERLNYWMLTNSHPHLQLVGKQLQLVCTDSIPSKSL